MRLYGYCTECRRFRLVNVSAHALALYAARVKVAPEGVCLECERRRP